MYNDLILSQEVLMYQQFRKRYTSYRIGDFSSRRFTELKDNKKLELPKGSILHLLDTLSSSENILPNVVNNIFIRNSTDLKPYLYHIDEVKHSPISIDEKFKFITAGFNREFIRHYRQNMAYVNRMVTIETINRTNILPVFNYNPLNRIIVLGQRAKYRKFQIIIKSILNTIMDLDKLNSEKMHFIQIDLSDVIYKRMRYIRAFSKINNTTIKLSDTYDFYFLLHILGYFRGDEFSLFNNLSEDLQDRVHFILRLKEKALIFNLRESKMIFDGKDAAIYQKFLKTVHVLKLLSEEKLIDKQTEPVDKVVEYNNKRVFILKSDNRKNVLKEIKAFNPEIIYSQTEDKDLKSAYGNKFRMLSLENIGNLSEEDQREIIERNAKNIKGFVERADKHIKTAFVLTPESQTETLAKTGVKTYVNDDEVYDKTALDDEEVVDKTIELNEVEEVELEEESEDLNLSPSDNKLIQEPKREFIITNKPLKEQFEEDTQNYVKEDGSTIKEKQVQKYKDTYYDSLDTLTYNGQLAKDILDKKVDTTVDTVPDDVEENLIDKSMSTLSIKSHDETYLEDQFDKDMLSVFMSFSQAGMVLTDVKIEDDVTELNALKLYRLTYKDVSGKSYKLNFRIPLLNSEGRLLFNGVNYELNKQLVNLPICKVSSNRVNLSSNYNKTLVEKTFLHSRRYDLTLLKYINRLTDADLVHVEYGGYDYNDVKVPLDYTYIATKYSKLILQDYVLTFDYNERFSSSLEAFRETKNIVSFNGSMYDLKSIKDYTKKKKVESITLDKLSWILRHDYPKRDISNTSNLEKPLIVTYVNDRYDVIDGLHRLYKHNEVNSKKVNMIFINQDELEDFKLTEKDELDYIKTLNIQETETYLKSIFCGYKNRKIELYYGLDNVIRVVDKSSDDVITETFTIRELLYKLYSDQESIEVPKITREYSELKILDKKFPVSFVLTYHLGITGLLDRLGHKYKIVKPSHRIDKSKDEIDIRFNDSKLIFSRYPLETGYVLAGLDKFDFKNYNLRDLDDKETYFSILNDNGLKTNYLKGIDNFFRYFVDPITKDVLVNMNLPTDLTSLLLLATSMLSDTFHHPPASLKHHRFRSHEIIPAIIYNSLARKLANSDSSRFIEKRSFSIGRDEILYSIIGDPVCNVVDTINPLHEIKMNNTYTLSGYGGRQDVAVVLSDRVHEEDALGTVSESSPDSSKVAINAVFTSDPNIKNIRGMFKENKKLEPSNIMSPSASLMPGALQDDSKRIGYISTQMSHHVPSLMSQPLRVRTGYETVIPYKLSSAFSAIAEQDGKITDVDEKLQLIKIKYKDGKEDIFEYGDKYSLSTGSFVKQTLEVNVKKGQSIKKGDILMYNKGYFSKDLDGIVSWNHGILAKVAVMDASMTYEDACEVSHEFSQKLVTTVGHSRLVQMTPKSIITNLVKIGDHVESTDFLLTISDEDVDFLADEDDEDLLSSLSKKSPKSKYNGYIVDIDIFYGCEEEELTDSLKSILKSIRTRKNKTNNAYKGTIKEGDVIYKTKIQPGTKYNGKTFDSETVLLEFTIGHDVGFSVGDKCVIASQMKTVCSNIVNNPTLTEENEKVDILFGASSINNRILTSPFIQGLSELILKKLEEDVVKIAEE